MPFKSHQDIEAERIAHQERIEKIAGRRGLTVADVTEVERYDDVVAIGTADLSYPGLIIVDEPKRLTIFRAADLGPQVRGQLTHPSKEVAVFHYGDKRFAKGITAEYDRLDALDDLAIGIQRHRWRSEDLVMAGYTRDSFVLNKDGSVSGNYKDLHASAKRDGWIPAREKAKERAEMLIEQRGIEPKEIWPPRQEGRGEILAIHGLDNDDEYNAVIAIYFEGGFYQLQREHNAVELSSGQMMTFKVKPDSHQDAYAIREVEPIRCYLSKDAEDPEIGWEFHSYPVQERQNYGPFEYFNDAMKSIDENMVEQNPYEMTLEDKSRIYPAITNAAQPEQKKQHENVGRER